MKWISIKEKLPALDTYVLVWDSCNKCPCLDKLVEFTRPFGIKLAWYICNYESQEHITHWLSIPEAPEIEME